MADPTNGVTASHYTTSGDYTLQDGLGGTHHVICEKVLDQYKAEREICESDRSLGITDLIQIKDKNGGERDLEFIGKTTYRRAHAICQAKGKLTCNSNKIPRYSLKSARFWSQNLWSVITDSLWKLSGGQPT